MIVSFRVRFLQFRYAVSMSSIRHADTIRDLIRWKKVSLLVLVSSRRHRCSISDVFIFAQMKYFLLLLRRLVMRFDAGQLDEMSRNILIPVVKRELRNGQAWTSLITFWPSLH